MKPQPGTLLLLVAPLCSLASCHQPITLQPDHGRAYTQAFATQADLSRPSVRQAAYPLSGEEGLALRANVRESTTDEEESTTVATSTSSGD